MKRFILKLLPVFVLEVLAPIIGTKDSIGNATFYRLYDAKQPKQGAGLLIRKK